MTDYPITPTSFRSVELRDSFWLPRLETNRTVTIPDVLGKCEEFGRIDNFRTAARRLQSNPADASAPGVYRGKMPFEDTDVYKAIEGASCSLVQNPITSASLGYVSLSAWVTPMPPPTATLYPVSTSCSTISIAVTQR